MEMFERELALSQLGNHESYLNYLDLLDRQALENWRKNVNQLNKLHRLRIPQEQQLALLAKIIDMYKIYGNNNTALVNPQDNPYILQIKDRDEVRKQQLE